MLAEQEGEGWNFVGTHTQYHPNDTERAGKNFMKPLWIFWRPTGPLIQRPTGICPCMPDDQSNYGRGEEEGPKSAFPCGHSMNLGYEKISKYGKYTKSLTKKLIDGQNNSASFFYITWSNLFIYV